MNRSIQTKLRRVSAIEHDGDAMPETLKKGTVGATIKAINDHVKQNGLGGFSYWRRRKKA